LEPRSALAHAYLAGAAAGRTHYLAEAKFLGLAEREAEEASQLAPDSGEVLRIVAGVKYQRGQFRKALEDGLRAMETGAPDWKICRHGRNGLRAKPARPIKHCVGSSWRNASMLDRANTIPRSEIVGPLSAMMQRRARPIVVRSTCTPSDLRVGFSTARLDLLSADFSNARLFVPSTTQP